MILSAITSGALLVDQKNWVNTKELYDRSPFIKRISDFSINFGDAKWQFGAAAIAITYGNLIKDRRIINTSEGCIEAIISSGMFVQIIKRFSGRQSPLVSSSSGGKWDLFPDLGEYQHNQPNYYAFPSGHITGATAVLTVIIENYPEVKWLKPVAYSLLGILGFSLVANDMHWYSDFPMALAIGYSFGKIISHRYDHISAVSESKNRVYIQPLLSQNGVGLLFSYSF